MKKWDDADIAGILNPRLRDGTDRSKLVQMDLSLMTTAHANVVKWDNRGMTDSAIARGELTITTTGNIDDLDTVAGDIVSASVLRMNNATLATLRGLQNGRNGQLITIVSVGAGAVSIANDNAGSSAVNRILTGTGGTITLAAGTGIATLQYDNTTTRWRLLVNSSKVDIQFFTTPGTNTWTKPLGAKTVRCICQGGGGGGGSGRKGATATIRQGGGGGGGGAYSEEEFNISDLTAATYQVDVGAGGAGGVAQATNSTNGNNGTAGGISAFAQTDGYNAGAGNGGIGGALGAGGGGGAGAGEGTDPGAAGAASSATGGVGTTPTAALNRGAGGGGSGGGITSGNVTSNGGQGGSKGVSYGLAGGAAGVAPGGAGGNTSSFSFTLWKSAGGGGGGASGTGAGGKGGDGSRGSGGGGGGAGIDSVGNSGAGGKGGDGWVAVITYF